MFDSDADVSTRPASLGAAPSVPHLRAVPALRGDGSARKPIVARPTLLAILTAIACAVSASVALLVARRSRRGTERLVLPAMEDIASPPPADGPPDIASQRVVAFIDDLAGTPDAAEPQTPEPPAPPRIEEALRRPETLLFGWAVGALASLAVGLGMTLSAGAFDPIDDGIVVLLAGVAIGRYLVLFLHDDGYRSGASSASSNRRYERITIPAPRYETADATTMIDDPYVY